MLFRSKKVSCVVVRVEMRVLSWVDDYVGTNDIGPMLPRVTALDHSSFEIVDGVFE